MSLTSYRAAPPRGEVWDLRGPVGPVDPERMCRPSRPGRGGGKSGSGGAASAVGWILGDWRGLRGAAAGSPLEKLEAPERSRDRGARLGDDEVQSRRDEDREEKGYGCAWQAWQRPTLPRLETKYHRR